MSGQNEDQSTAEAAVCETDPVLGVGLGDGVDTKATLP